MVSTHTLWMLDLVRCPQHTVMEERNVTMNGTHALVKTLFNSQHRVMSLLETEEVPVVKYTDWYPMLTITVLTSIMLAMSLAFAAYTYFRLGGVRLLQASDDAAKALIDKKMDKSTDNRWWVFFFLLTAVRTIIEIVSFEAKLSHDSLLILVAVHRMFLGLQMLVFTIALNFQRIHRTRDSKKSGVSQNLLRQVKKMNTAAMTLFIIYTVIDFGCSHAAFVSQTARDGLFWTFIVVMLLLAIPMTLCTVWVTLHRAEVEPRPLAKRLLLFASIMYFITLFPPSLWNKYLIKSTVEKHPCPLHFMSIYDCFIAVDIIGRCLMMAFIKMEHNRNKIQQMKLHYQDISGQLNATKISREAEHLRVRASQDGSTEYSLRRGGMASQRSTGQSNALISQRTFGSESPV